jgi:O-methyltransferase involved in polyketide biosynthesis
MHSPDDVLQHAETTKLIDFDQPVGILMIAMTHFLTVDERPSVMGRLRDALAPGSHLTVTHVTTDDKAPEAVAQIEAVYATTPTPIYFRDRANIEEFFAGFELVEPGLVTPDDWRPDPDDPAPEATKWLYAGVGRKP